MSLTRLIISLLIVGMVACTPRTKYEKMIEAGLNSDKEFNDLFLGLYLGMEDSLFRSHCYELNQQKILFQGDKGLSALYKMKELNYPANMNFYPNFFESRIYQMPVIFDYEGWAPWNRNFYSDSLQMDILNLFEDWYGPGFLEVRHPEKGSAFVKVDGNRKISLFKDGDRFVKAHFTDIVIEKKIEEMRAEAEDKPKGKAKGEGGEVERIGE